MFCFQCQETAKGSGCTIAGVCGKQDRVANMQDLLVFVTKGISFYAKMLRDLGIENDTADKFIVESLFMTITNANFDNGRFITRVREGLKLRDELKTSFISAGGKIPATLHESTTWTGSTVDEFEIKNVSIGVLSTKNEDVRSLREMITYGLKGMAAYTEHAYNLGFEDRSIYKFIQDTLVALTDDTLTVEQLVALVMETGRFGVAAMALLDKANTSTYGNPEITKVNIGVRNNPGILISGHDLRDMEDLLKQTEGTGVDVYTHS